MLPSLMDRDSAFQITFIMHDFAKQVKFYFCIGSGSFHLYNLLHLHINNSKITIRHRVVSPNLNHPTAELSDQGPSAPLR
jgi:hypothetical protein